MASAVAISYVLKARPEHIKFFWSRHALLVLAGFGPELFVHRFPHLLNPCIYTGAGDFGLVPLPVVLGELGVVCIKM